jgi:flagellar hook-associated protein 3 FlgL
MRISTNTIFQIGTGKLSELQASLIKTQQQISSNRRVLTPADDPVAAAAALNVTQAIAVNAQYGVNRQNAKSALSEEESILQSITGLLQDVKALTVTAGNGALDGEQRGYLAAELRGRFDELMSMANTRDGAGNYVFAGYQTSTQPFSKTLTGAQYNGDQGQRMLQVGASRQLAVSDSGSKLFESIKTGNRTFVTAAAAGNTGAGIITTGSVVDTTQLSGRNYSVTFAVDPEGVTTYSVADTSLPALVPPPTLPTSVPYVSGQAITFNGMQFDISGAPADGDVFTVKPSSNQSIFETLNNLLNTLTAPATGAAGQAALANGLNTANINIDNALENVSAVRTSIGSRLKEIDSLDSSGSDLNIQYTQRLSELQDIDPVEAISSFTQQQITLEAAQKSFMAVSGLSLFKLI